MIRAEQTFTHGRDNNALKTLAATSPSSRRSWFFENGE
jgi:hypothetical protein